MDGVLHNFFAAAELLVIILRPLI